MNTYFISRVTGQRYKIDKRDIAWMRSGNEWMLCTKITSEKLTIGKNIFRKLKMHTGAIKHLGKVVKVPYYYTDSETIEFEFQGKVFMTHYKSLLFYEAG